MKKSLLFLLPAVFAFNLTSASALEIDEKLTLRFLNVSSTKKTVLINRGGEDGLVVGDHAKFFITAGVVARGVAEKVSPSRSVWSLYRIVDPAEITQDKVLNLKIASPVKITDDPSRSLKEEVIPGGTEKMDVLPNDNGEATSDDPDQVINDADKDEMKELGMNEDGADEEVATVKKSSKKKETKIVSSKKSGAKNTTVMEDSTPEYTPNNNSKTWEVWGTLAANSLTGTVDTGTTTTTNASTGATNTSLDLSAGIEKYFIKQNNFLKEFSIALLLHKISVENGDQVKSKTEMFEYGLGANYHFYNSAASVSKLIGFATGTFGKGTSSLSSTSVVNGVSTTEELKGDTVFFSAGVGAKYVLSNGFGVRAVVDYYHATETYAFDDSTTTRTLAGPRVQFGLSYRF